MPKRKTVDLVVDSQHSAEDNASPASRLLQCNDASVWQNIEKEYQTALQALSDFKKKPKLLELDDWVWNQLNSSGIARSKEAKKEEISLAELSKIMQWKLIRGKFRPLQKLVDSNLDSTVKECTRSALSCLQNEDWRTALNHLMKLKGIGVATASAILAVFLPTHCCFMADEVIEAITPGSREYKVPEYVHMLEVLGKVRKTLGEEAWTVEKCAKALWTIETLRKCNHESFSNLNSILVNSSSGPKRAKSCK